MHSILNIGKCGKFPKTATKYDGNNKNMLNPKCVHNNACTL